MENNTNRMKEQILRTSGVNPLKCMRCGKCSGTCPAYDEPWVTLSSEANPDGTPLRPVCPWSF